jgi:hypothetical protein
LNRKILADLAVRDPEGFAELAKLAQQELGPAEANQPAVEPAEASPQAAEPAEA